MMFSNQNIGEIALIQRLKVAIVRWAILWLYTINCSKLLRGNVVAKLQEAKARLSGISIHLLNMQFDDVDRSNMQLSGNQHVAKLG